MSDIYFKKDKKKYSIGYSDVVFKYDPRNHDIESLDARFIRCDKNGKAVPVPKDKESPKKTTKKAKK